MKQRRLWTTKQEWGHWSFSTTEIVLIFQIRKPRECCFKKTCWETMVNVQPNEKHRSICSKNSNFIITLFDTVSVSYYHLNMVLNIIYHILIIFCFIGLLLLLTFYNLKKSGLQLKNPNFLNFYQLKISLFISYKLFTLCNGVATGSFCI